ncbi:glycoside hydrolase family 43 protein [Arthrobacter agilis]|uniref:glycoside hydrolase family 43 protein n=1 Tax=Arthrobacter agilis TaxID=37921 RepID=UPI0023658D6C|nr:glycoside hydrolase family 43 protein [Arthrobacter agilis]WDF33915.1 glycoside hydrolase family 43 protein [Arthrobacter agilis]
MNTPLLRRCLGLLAVGALAAATAGCSPSDTPAAVPEVQGNPTRVLDEEFADPDILEVDGTYYAYATAGNRKNVQVATSPDLLEWEMLDDDALPDLPSWTIPGKTWAPEVTQVADGTFVLYFTTTNFKPALQCIGVATATDPAGPFTVVGDEMLVCPEDEGGAIDASTFVTDAGLNLVWKNDGNCCDKDTWIQTAPLSADGRTITGPTTKLIRQTLDWEGLLIEAPTVVPRDSGFVLLYSSNYYGDASYNVGLASAPALDGPWEKAPAPILSSDSFGGDRYVGPGGQDLATSPDGQPYLLFHSWDAAVTYRSMHAEPVEWQGTELHFRGDERG